MRYVLAICLVLWASAPLAQETAIQGVISDQIARFQADDVEGAFEHASPGIRRLFGTAERFGAMVRQGYPMVWRPGEVRYLNLREIGGALWQKVLIRDRAGRTHLLDYQMVEGENGWKINAVQVLEAPGAAV
ncbi:protein of unknown function [Salinihabitans flavidus]|uniref:DUF4864 domain-containing protein n=1 Tax=Salinihabitans flavidus TaxID=569882 RepID=A0A1H8LFV0_9RHOB|nr:DUF4864 domain-containing protein [Salinihabitans flavidus]SEO04082.1 protein of unknown function [Salinihabitans flavidus]